MTAHASNRIAVLGAGPVAMGAALELARDWVRAAAGVSQPEPEILARESLR